MLRSYYHGRISRDDAVDLLTREGRDGSFLLRLSETQDGVYTVSVMFVLYPLCSLMGSTVTLVHCNCYRQGQAVRHIRVINQRGTVMPDIIGPSCFYIDNIIADGYVLSKGDPPERTVWELINNQMHRTLTNSFNAHDAVALRYDLSAPQHMRTPSPLLKIPSRMQRHRHSARPHRGGRRGWHGCIRVRQ